MFPRPSLWRVPRVFAAAAASRAGAQEDGSRPDEEHVAALRARLTRIGLDPIDALAGH